MAPKKHKSVEAKQLINVEIIKETCEEVLQIGELRPFQINSWKKLSEGHDVLVIAGTGTGKTLIFEGLVFANTKATVLVISPLTALMEEQVDNPATLG